MIVNEDHMREYFSPGDAEKNNNIIKIAIRQQLIELRIEFILYAYVLDIALHWV